MFQFLVVDPDTDVSALLATDLLERFGAAVTRTVSGEMATQVLHKMPCDLALIAVMLPDMSGFELAERAADCNVPALLMSGHPEGKEKSRVHGYPLLDKPFRLSAMEHAATIALRNGQQNIDRLHKAYQSLTGTFQRTQIIGQQIQQTREEARRIRSESQQVRLEASRLRVESATTCEAWRTRSLYRPDVPASIELLVVLENIARFRRLLQPDRANRLDERIERTVKLLLAEQEAKLLALDQTRKPQAED